MKEQKLLLLSCCAPCSVGVIRDLAEQGVNVTVLFYNPNIRPETEYRRRLAENERVCRHYRIPFVALPYHPEEWDAVTCGLEDEPERGKRCEACFFLRLRQAAKYAKEHGFTSFSSVLGFSRYKDFDQVCRMGEKAADAEGIPYDLTNWRKNGGEQKASQLAQELHLYRQNYCGCKPRKTERD